MLDIGSRGQKDFEQKGAGVKGKAVQKSFELWWGRGGQKVLTH